ncbi:O-antigen ligase family protein [Pseudomonas sp. NPDC007930]|uniref:O-antigen ligase family protein n=1 Tax=Pseudomonas sp. NPDC007930 TaxID=3364417 RepID=UPI0036E5620F
MNTPRFAHRPAWIHAYFLLLALAAALSLLHRGLALKLFTLAGAIGWACAAAVAWAHWRGARPAQPSALALWPLLLAGFALGLSKWLWAWHFGSPGEDLAYNQQEGGKRIMLAMGALWCAYHCRAALAPTGRRQVAWVLLAGLGLALLAGVLEHQRSGWRVRLNTDAATTAAYLITAYGLATASAVRQAFSPRGLGMALFLLATLMALALVGLTRTRSAVLLAPWLFLLLAWPGARQLPARARWLVVITILLAGALVLNAAWQRVARLPEEFTHYGTQNNTSTSSRLLLWKAGVLGQTPSVWGETVQQRASNLGQYLNTFEQGNPGALASLRYHLHNELLDTLALRGVAAAALLLAFYAALLGLAIRARHLDLLLFALPLLLFGLVDVVLHQRLACLALFSQLALVASTLPQRQPRAAAAPEGSLNGMLRRSALPQ